ncbi:MAG: SpoIIE family protein phosphatase [Capsulimonadaceae bacterium]
MDDRAENLTVLTALLEPLGHPIETARSGAQTLKQILKHDFAVILLDVLLPDIDGFETATLIKQREKSRTIPIIFITALSTDPRDVFQGYSAGAVDYITKPFDPDILRSKVSVFIDLHQKGEQIKVQAEQLRKSELREAERRRETQKRALEQRHLAELRASEAKLSQFKSMLDATLDCVLIFEPQTERFVYANRGAVDQLEYSEEDILQLTPAAICDSAPDFDALRRQLGNGAQSAITFETQHKRASGSEVPVEVLVQYVPHDGEHGRFIWIARDITERKRAASELEEAYAREKRIAEVLQRSLLLAPPEDSFPGISVATLYEAAWDEASLGGDFFDAFHVGPDTVVLVVGDVTGKGLKAAARTAEVKFTLRAFARESADPSRLLSRINRCLVTQWGDTDEQVFVCVSVVVWDARKSMIQASSAGCEPPIVVRASGELETLQATGLPLAIRECDEYPHMEVALGPGDFVAMVTDGITESRRNGDMFGEELLKQCLTASLAEQSANSTAQAVLDAAKQFAGGRLQDDACVLVARRDAGR